MADTTLTHENGRNPALTAESAGKPTHTNPTPIAPNGYTGLLKDRVIDTPAYQHIANGNRSPAPVRTNNVAHPTGNVPNSVNVHKHTQPTGPAKPIINPPMPGKIGTTVTANNNTGYINIQ